MCIRDSVQAARAVVAQAEVTCVRALVRDVDVEAVSYTHLNAQLEGKAAFYDLFIDLKHSTNLRTTAKELDVPERRFVRFLIERRFVYRTASGNVLPYANVKNAGLFCVKDYCNHGHIGSYTLVTPQGKLYFAQLREMILLVS